MAFNTQSGWFKAIGERSSTAIRPNSGGDAKREAANRAMRLLKVDKWPSKRPGASEVYHRWRMGLSAKKAIVQYVIVHIRSQLAHCAVQRAARRWARAGGWSERVGEAGKNSSWTHSWMYSVGLEGTPQASATTRHSRPPMRACLKISE